MTLLGRWNWYLPSWLELVDDPADRRGDDRAPLPERLGDGQAETLSEALLHDHCGMALQGVDDARVCCEVAHPDRDKMHARALRRRKECPLPLHLGENLRLLRVVADAVHGGPGKDQVSAERRVDILRERPHDAGHVLHAVPSGDLHY